MPEPDDLAGYCFLYPAGTFKCVVDADCPAEVGDGPQGEDDVVQVPPAPPRVAEGRPQKYLSPVNLWPSNFQPTTRLLAVTVSPFPLPGASCAPANISKE